MLIFTMKKIIMKGHGKMILDYKDAKTGKHLQMEVSDKLYNEARPFAKEAVLLLKGIKASETLVHVARKRLICYQKK